MFSDIFHFPFRISYPSASLTRPYDTVRSDVVVLMIGLSLVFRLFVPVAHAHNRVFYPRRITYCHVAGVHTFTRD